eukprot:4668174-Pyramimonas_sp.AAC.1
MATTMASNDDASMTIAMAMAMSIDDDNAFMMMFVRSIHVEFYADALRSTIPPTYYWAHAQ